MIENRLKSSENEFDRLKFAILHIKDQIKPLQLLIEEKEKKRVVQFYYF